MGNERRNRTWYKLPLWAEKEYGPWSLVGGMGYTVIPQTGFRNFLYGGFLVKRELSKKLELSIETFSHAREGIAAAQTQASSMIDAGGYYHFQSPGLELLSPTATRSPARPKTTATSAFIRPGVKIEAAAGNARPTAYRPSTRTEPFLACQSREPFPPSRL